MCILQGQEHGHRQHSCHPAVSPAQAPASGSRRSQAHSCSRRSASSGAQSAGGWGGTAPGTPAQPPAGRPAAGQRRGGARHHRIRVLVPRFRKCRASCTESEARTLPRRQGSGRPCLQRGSMCSATLPCRSRAGRQVDRQASSSPAPLWMHAWRGACGGGQELAVGRGQRAETAGRDGLSNVMRSGRPWAAQMRRAQPGWHAPSHPLPLTLARPAGPDGFSAAACWRGPPPVPRNFMLGCACRHWHASRPASYLSLIRAGPSSG